MSHHSPGFCNLNYPKLFLIFLLYLMYLPCNATLNNEKIGTLNITDENRSSRNVFKSFYFTKNIENKSDNKQRLDFVDGILNKKLNQMKINTNPNNKQNKINEFSRNFRIIKYKTNNNNIKSDINRNWHSIFKLKANPNKETIGTQTGLSNESHKRKRSKINPSIKTFANRSGFTTSKRKKTTVNQTNYLNTNKTNRKRRSSLSSNADKEDKESIKVLNPLESYTNVTSTGLGNATVADIGSKATGNSSSNATGSDEKTCPEWKGGQNTLFQIGNLLYLVAFFVPHSFRASALMMRACITGGVALFTAWAGVHLCALDVFLWYVILLVVNLIHTLRLAYLLWPARIAPQLLDFYNKLFKPLKVTRDPFSHLAREGKIEHLSTGQIYADEDITPAGEKLAVLLTGRLTVSCDCTHIHYIFPNQFVDSVEWEACGGEGGQGLHLFQVTVTADDDCTLFVWPRTKLKALFHDKVGLRTVVHSLIGKDITTKLYSLTEQINHSADSISSRASSVPILLPGDRTTPARSISADAVHTGNRGLVRSTVWRSSSRRAASATGNSPNHQLYQVSPVIPRHSSTLVHSQHLTEGNSAQSQFLSSQLTGDNSPSRSISNIENYPRRSGFTRSSSRRSIMKSEFEEPTNRSLASIDNRVVDNNKSVINSANVTNQKFRNLENIDPNLVNIVYVNEKESRPNSDNGTESKGTKVLKKRSSVVRCVEPSVSVISYGDNNANNLLHAYPTSHFNDDAQNPNIVNASDKTTAPAPRSKSLHGCSTSSLLDDPELLETVV